MEDVRIYRKITPNDPVMVAGWPGMGSVALGVVDYLANGDKSFPKERLEVFCEGMIAVLDDYVSLTVIKDGKKNVQSGAQDKGWKNEMAAFARSIREGTEPPIRYDHLIGVTKSTFAAVESISSGNKVNIQGFTEK